ncbi:VOC family protein [Amycolatopsis sp. NPDC004368]
MKSKIAKRTGILGVVAAAVAGVVVAVSAGSAEGTPDAAGWRTPVKAWGVQYDASHVYLQHGTLPAFIKSWEGTFGGTDNGQNTFQITPTPSKALASIIHSPVGLLAAYDYQTPVPYPFGAEQTGFGVHDPDLGADAALRSGAEVTVTPWTGPVGREAVVKFPGGFASQIWLQYDMSGFTPLKTQPEFRVYLTESTVNAFLASYLKFTGGSVISDVRKADGGEVGAPGTTYHRIRIATPFGNTVVLANNGDWAYPYGRDTTGYTVSDVAATVAKAEANGATVLSGPYKSSDRTSVVLQFPGGYIAEVHDGTFH